MVYGLQVRTASQVTHWIPTGADLLDRLCLSQFELYRLCLQKRQQPGRQSINSPAGSRYRSSLPTAEDNCPAAT